jgi:acyl carrier protein
LKIKKIKKSVKEAAAVAFGTPISKITDNSSFLTDMNLWDEFRAAHFVMLIEKSIGVSLERWENITDASVASVTDMIANKL